MVLHVFLVLSISFLHLTCCIGQDLPNQAASVGVFFDYTLPKEKFASDESFPNYIKFTVSKFGGPDLPKWLRLEQDTPTDDAVIYGTPPPDSQGNLTLEITGWDKRDYATKRRNINIVIDSSKEPPQFVAEFIIKNFNIDNFLVNKTQPNLFRSKLEEIWRSPTISLKVVKVESMLDRGGRVPIPPKKEGVFIAVGGDKEYTLLRADLQGCQGLKPDIKKKFDATDVWDIDWCNVKLYDTKDPAYIANMSSSSTTFKDPIIPSSYSPPEMEPVPRDYGDLYVAVLILPVIIILIIVIILAIIMCCFRQGKDKRDAATPRPQLQYHDSILRTTFQLRRMDSDNPDVTRRNNGQTPRPESPVRNTSTPYERTVTPDEEDSSPRGAPPPYRLPPPAAVSVTTPNGSQFYQSSA